MSFQFEYATCAKLLNYPDKPAPAGSQLVPEVAQSLPTRSTDGKTYTFTIRKGFRFSPPSDEPVTAQTFKYAIERSLGPEMKGPAGTYLSDVVGAKAYVAGKADHIAGVVAHGSRLTIRLTAPTPDLVSRIAMPFFCAIPLGTPLEPRGVSAIPSAGPYYVASYTPGQGVVLERNPNYKGSRPHHLERIVLTVGVSRQTTVAQIEHGVADYALDGIPPADAPRLAARYGPGSRAAKRGRQQFFLNPRPGLDFLALNTHRPLFGDVRLRRAVNYAIDPRRGDTVYAAGYFGVRKTTDGGKSWRIANAGLTVKSLGAIAIAPRRPRTLYVGIGSTRRNSPADLFKSTDAGKTWRAISTGLPNKDVGALVIDPHAPRTIYAGSGSHRYSGARGVFKSTDGGRHWHPFNAGLANGAVRALTTDQRGRVLYAGTDGDGVLTSTSNPNGCPAPRSAHAKNARLIAGKLHEGVAAGGEIGLERASHISPLSGRQILVSRNAAGQTQHIAANYRPRSSLLLLSRLVGEKIAGTPYATYFLAGES